MKRIAGFAAANVGYYGLAKGTQLAMGFTDEEVEDRKLLASGPFSAGHDMIFTRDSDGEVYGLNTQYLNSYYTIQAPIRTALDQIVEGKLKGKEAADIGIDAMTEAMIEITKPYISESIAVGPIRSLISAYWNKTGRDSTGKVIVSEKDGVHWDNVMDVLTKSFAPAFVIKTENFLDALNKKPRDWDQSYRDPYYEGWSQLGFNWSKQDLGRNFYDQIKSHQMIDRLNGLNRINFSTSIDDVKDDIIKTNSIEFQNQSDLYLYVKAARRQLDDVDVLVQLREAGYSIENATMLMRGEFKPTRLPKDQLSLKTAELNRLNETDFHKYQEKLNEVNRLSQEMYTSMDRLPLDNAKSFNIKIDTSFLDSNPPLTPKEREEAGLMKKATGGEVSTPVPNAPIEPDERINKLTGRPYNEDAGTAYMDEDDPMRRMNMAAGGRVRYSKGKLVKLIAEPLAKIIKKYSKKGVSDELAEEAANKILRKFKGSDDMPSLLDDPDMEDYIKLETKVLLEEKHDLTTAQLQKQFPDVIERAGGIGGEEFSKVRGYTADERETFEAASKYDDLLGDTSDVRAEIQYALDELKLTQKEL